MKRCPKCNRTYSTDTQKFCTHDGGLLFQVQDDLGQTVQFDSSKVRESVSKPTTRDLGEQPSAQFDPEATVVTQAPAEGTQQVRSRDTGGLERPAQTQYYGASSGATTGPVSSAAPTVVGSVPPTPSAPLPSPHATPSGPIAPPAAEPVAQAASGPITAPPAQAPAAAAQPGRPLPATSANKKSKLPLILGLLAVLIILFVGVGVVAGYFFWFKPRQDARATERAATTEPVQTAPSLPSTTTASEASVPSTEPPPYNPPADAVQFVNSQDSLSGRLAENFVAFSFYYPDRWVKVPSSENFIMVERRLPPDFTQENFAVAPWYSTGETTTFDDAFFQGLVAKDDANFKKRLSEYRKVSEGRTKVGTYDAYELRFEAVSRGTDKGDVTLWGREIFFPPREGEKTGVKFLILTTSLAPELRTIDDVGVKGELPMLLESFRFGK